MLPCNLPPEILDEIIRISPKATQIALYRASRQFRSLATRSLYKKISLINAASLMQLCTTLRSNSVAAACVKHLSVSYIPPSSFNTRYLSNFYRHLKAAFLELVNLQDLCLLVADLALIQCLFDSTAPLQFPSLKSFQTYLPLDELVLSFVERHPKLNFLEVSHSENLRSDSPPPQPCENATHGGIRAHPILRKLHHFVGNSVYLANLTPAYPLPLRSAYVIWDATQECQGPITSLGKAASYTLNFLTCRRRGWNLDLIELIAAQLPDIYVLHIVNVVIIDSQITQGYQEDVARHLTRCRRLSQLKITRETKWRPSEVQSDLDTEFSIVTDWGAACPSLVVIALPHSYPHVEWHRFSENLWVPIDLSFHGTARGWLKDPARRWKYLRVLKNLKQPESHISAPLIMSL